jgi:hypothetical protein
VLPGATVVLTIAGQERRACFAATRGWFGLSYRLNVNDQISVRQEFRLCELVSRTASVVVKNDRPLPPVLPGPICEGDRLVQVDGMVKEALLEFRVSRPSGQSTWRAGAPEGSARLGVPSLSGAQTLEVRQSACDGASWSWSDWSAPRRIRPLGTQWPPGIEWPLIDGGLAVGVRNLRKGSFVQIVSKKKKGAIGQAWGNGDHRIDVPLWYPLIESDVIHLRSRRCGQTVDWGDPTTVLPRRDLPPPTVADPACDCGGSVLVRDVVPGTIVEVFLKRPGGTFAAAGSARSGASEVSVDVPPLNPGAPPLQPGDQLKARQRMPYGVSSEGSVATSGALPRWAYVADKAHRICQLTQDWEPTDRPHPGNTTPIGITGTDLGIPVEHNGRMYLFFGDCREAPDVTTDADPIAWTTDDDPDDLETWPLDLHWILGNDGKFRRLAVNGLPPLENFEVPTGAFSYEGRVYLFVAREKRLAPDRMIASFLAGVGDPQQNFELLQVISRTEGPLDPAQTPGRRFMLHISPVVVSNAAWPGLPSATGDGLLLFGSSNYRGIPENERTAIEVTNGNVYLAWAPLTSGTWPAAPIPRADQWMFVVGFTPAGTPIWDRLGGPRPPFPILPPDPPPPGGVPFPRLVGEISAAWYPALRRWLVAASPETRINVARFPWGPFTTSDFICAAGVADRDARNLMPGEEWCKTKVTYAPYLIPRWLKWDRSTRTATLYFTLSIHDLPNNQHRYQPQLMRSDIRC